MADYCKMKLKVAASVESEMDYRVNDKRPPRILKQRAGRYPETQTLIAAPGLSFLKRKKKPVETGSTEQMSRQQTDDPHKGYFGLYNQGATCYLNTLLQTLYMTPEVKNAIIRFVEETAEPINKDANICYQLKELFANLENGSARTHGITRNLGLSKKVFEQQDVEEYFRLLLNKIDGESNGSCKVLQIYQSKMINSLKCLECKTQSREECIFLDIPLSLSSPDHLTGRYFNSVNESLEEFLKVVTLSGDNLCYCKTCEKKTETETRYYFESLPQVLALQLKRFEFDYFEMRFKKLHTSIKIPQKLKFQKKVKDHDKTEWRFLSNETMDATMTSVTEQEPQSSQAGRNDETDERQKLLKDKGQEEEEKQWPKDEKAAKLAMEVEETRRRMEEDNLLRMQEKNHREEEQQKCEDVERDKELQKQESIRQQQQEALRRLQQQQQQQKLAQMKDYATYDLFAICDHTGVKDSGHYVAYIKPISSHKWYCFNDALVHEQKDIISEESCGGSSSTSDVQSIRSSTAYMLVYRKEEVNSNQGGNADEDEQCNEQMSKRKFSEIGNGEDNHDFEQSNPPSNQNTDDSPGNIDIEMKEENGTEETKENMRRELVENGRLMHSTDEKEGGKADADEQWNEQTRMRKSSGIGNGANNHDIGQDNPPSDQNAEYSSERIDAERKEANATTENIENTYDLKEKEKETGETDCKEGETTDQENQSSEPIRRRDFSEAGNGVNNQDLGQSNPPSNQNIEDPPKNFATVMKEDDGQWAGGTMEKKDTQETTGKDGVQVVKEKDAGTVEMLATKKTQRLQY
ncbi:golgin subfamily A member 6-like protein 22 [Rhincodon typus]|uniref:golgin subfamily A member 6-like protein 22 n=1 Tax=Rhincodon typus TaxID=259920 RepID=UPI0020306B32|nr:golgin subfamily A member 6-like protein 22 [Rhincodon typus]